MVRRAKRFGAQPKLSDSRLFFQRTLAALRTDPLQYGRYVNFNSSKASVMLVVQLAICVRSRKQTTSARWEFFSTSIFEVDCHLVGLVWKKLHDKLVYKGPLPVSCYCGRGDSPLIGVTDTADFITSTSMCPGPQVLGSLRLRRHIRGISATLCVTGFRHRLATVYLRGLESLQPYEGYVTGHSRDWQYRRVFLGTKRFLFVELSTFQFVFTLEGLIGSGPGFFSAVVCWLNVFNYPHAPEFPSGKRALALSLTSEKGPWSN